jgi:succinate dehydrogenase / fumarate reductase cytochrome b subunit
MLPLAQAMSSISLKATMSVTGFILWAYLIVHMLGNFQILVKPGTAFNDYAEFLKGNALLLWGERVVVFGSMIAHAYTAVRLTRLNRAARPEDYARRKTATSTLMSRTMIVSGLVVLAFFVYHILHFTIGAVGDATFRTEHGRPDAFFMVHSAFKIGWVVAIYVVGQVLLFMHLYHGSMSLLQSIGAYRIFRNPRVRAVAWVMVLAVCGGFISIPLVIYFSWPAP